MGIYEGYFDFLCSYEVRSFEEFVCEILMFKGSMYKKKNFLKVGLGKEQFYSNINVVVVGFIVEQVSGKFFVIYVEEVIFEFLGMGVLFWFGEKFDCVV